MAQLTTTSVTINGKPIRQFHSLSLTQGIFEHHHFRLTCPSDAVDTVTGTMFNQSKSLVGAVFTAQIDAVNVQGSLKFRGIVTGIEAEKFRGSSGDVVISGYSATLLLDNGPHCKTWEKKAVKNIAQDVVKHFPQNLLNPKISPAYPETLAYYVQYKETAWRFLNRMCSTYGEWLFFDGQSLIIGSPSASTPAVLVFGNNLSRFSLGMQVIPASLQMMAYDYINHQVYTSKPEGVEARAGLNENGKNVYQVSQSVYASQPKQWNNHFVSNKKQLDDVVNIQSAMRSANHIKFLGTSGHPGVMVGGTVNVSGQNVFSESSEEYGSYTVISVNHFTDGQGNYRNDFEAIPSSVKVPPVSMLPEPVSDTQSAIVTDNHDPGGLGRVRVKFHWMNGSEKSPWIRVTSPHGGGGKGMHFIPEVGEEVIVGFEGDSPLKPYIVGTVYHGKAKQSYSNAGNDVKALQTRSGNKVIMNDNAGSIHIQDSKGNDMMMDGAGNINIKSSATIVLTCGKSKIEMKSDGTININGRDITTTGTESIVSNTKKRMVSATEVYSVQGKENSITGTNNTIAGSSNKVTGTNYITGGNTKIDGGDVFIN